MVNGLPITRVGGMDLKIIIFTIQKTIQPLSFWETTQTNHYQGLTLSNPFYTRKKVNYSSKEKPFHQHLIQEETKQQIMKNVIIAILCLIATSTFAQSEDDAIKSTINAYTEGFTKGDSASINRAFVYNAILRNLNPSSGKIIDTPLKKFIAGMPAGGAKATGSLLNYSYVGTSALASVEFKFADFKYIDLLSLIKVNGEWKIVCRVFSRVGLDENLSSANVAGKASGGKAAPAPVKKAVAKPKADDGW